MATYTVSDEDWREIATAIFSAEQEIKYILEGMKDVSVNVGVITSAIKRREELEKIRNAMWDRKPDLP